MTLSLFSCFTYINLLTEPLPTEYLSLVKSYKLSKDVSNEKRVQFIIYNERQSLTTNNVIYFITIFFSIYNTNMNWIDNMRNIFSYRGQESLTIAHIVSIISKTRRVLFLYKETE